VVVEVEVVDSKVTDGVIDGDVLLLEFVVVVVFFSVVVASSYPTKPTIPITRIVTANNTETMVDIARIFLKLYLVSSVLRYLGDVTISSLFMSRGWVNCVVGDALRLNNIP
jgi:hypothetical protein